MQRSYFWKKIDVNDPDRTKHVAEKHIYVKKIMVKLVNQRPCQYLNIFFLENYNGQKPAWIFFSKLKKYKVCYKCSPQKDQVAYNKIVQVVDPYAGI